MLVMRNTMRGGRRAGWVTACGTLSGLTIWALAAALGLSALLRVSHVGYDILRVCGAAYLIWLGVTSLSRFRLARFRLARFRHTSRTEPAAEDGGTGAALPGRAGLSLAGPGAARPARAYLNGLLSNLLNPK